MNRLSGLAQRLPADKRVVVGWGRRHCRLPLLSGFVSKWLISTLREDGQALPALLAWFAACTMFTFCGTSAFFWNPSPMRQPKKRRFYAWGMGILRRAVGLGVAPQLLFHC